MQFLIYLRNLAQGDLGISFARAPARVQEMIAQALPWTIALQLPAIVIGWVLGNVLGALAAYKGGWLDRGAFSVSLFISSIPYYCLAILLLYTFAVHWPVFPPGGGYSYAMSPSWNWYFIQSALYHYWLPFLSLVLIFIGGQAVGMRAMAIYELDADYVRYSRGMGVSDNRIVAYIFRNAVLPQVTGWRLPSARSSVVRSSPRLSFVSGDRHLVVQRYPPERLPGCAGGHAVDHDLCLAGKLYCRCRLRLYRPENPGQRGWRTLRRTYGRCRTGTTALKTESIFWTDLRRMLAGAPTFNRRFLTSLGFLVVLVGFGFLGPLILDKQEPMRTVGGLFDAPSATNWLGTDNFGRDVFTQLMFGIRTSLIIGLIAGAVATLIGVFIGTAAGYSGASSKRR